MAPAKGHVKSWPGRWAANSRIVAEHLVDKHGGSLRPAATACDIHWTTLGRYVAGSHVMPLERAVALTGLNEEALATATVEELRVVLACLEGE